MRKGVATTDRQGRPVTVGARVRIVEIAASVTRDLPKEERQDVESMLGEVLEDYEIDEHGAAWVEKSWDEGDGHHRSHSLGLDPHEMELV